MGIRGWLVAGLMLLAGQAHADDGVGAVLDVRTHMLTFSRRVPADTTQRLSIQVVGSDVASASLDVWPHIDRSPCETRPSDTSTQYQHLALTVGGTAEARTLEATIAPLQISTRYCFLVSYERPAGDSAELIDAISSIRVPWQDSCGDPDQVRTAVKDQVKVAITPKLAGTAYDASGNPTALHAAADIAGDTERIVKVIVDHLDLNAKCNAINHVEAIYKASLADSTKAGIAQQLPLAALAQLPTEIRAWPVVMAGTPAKPTRLIDLVVSQANVNTAILADVDKVAPALGQPLRAYASEADPTVVPTKRAALEQQFDTPPNKPIKLGLYLPGSLQFVLASDLVATVAQRSRLLHEVVAAPDVFDRQLELLGWQDDAVADRWRAALLDLAKAGQALDNANKAVAAARAARDTEIHNPVSTTLTKDNVSKLLVESDVTVGATFSSAPAEVDDKASWVSPIAGLLVAVPFIRGLDRSGSRVTRGSDAWLTPYLGGSIYTCRVDRVIDVGALVGNTTCQRLSLTIGVLASTPQINHKDVRGPWSVSVVPMAGVGYRLNQYFHADLGAILFQYADLNPAIVDYRWGMAGWLGFSFDADVWAVIGGKLGK
jgi:hypothetical protein